MSALETNDARTAAYLDELTALLAQGRIVTEEARLLAGLLARSGSPAEEIRGVSARLLESFRQAAFAHPWISADQLRHLRAAAASLSQPTYFDDLIPPPAPPAPEPGSGSFARPVRKPPPQALPPRLQRCGNCLAIGHSITDCPRLGSRRTGPADRPWPTLRVDRIRPIGPA